MLSHKKYLLLLAALIAILLLVSACGVNTASSAQSTPPLQVLQKSYSAMKQLKTAHFTMQIAEQMSMGSGSSTNIKISANGDEALPDKAEVHLTELSMKLSAITLGREMYIQNTKGQWYVLQLSQAQASAGNPFAGTSLSAYNVLLALAARSHFVDHGMQTLNGQSLRHITVTLDKSALQQIISSNLGSSLGNANTAELKQLLNKLTIQNTSLDLWIDPTTYYVHQMELKYTINLNAGSFVTPTPSTSTALNLSMGTDTTIDFSNFNAPVTITAPSHAIPANNLSSVFGV
mgnify:CR=1 FL=1